MKNFFIIAFALALCSCNKDSVYEKDVLDYSNMGYSRSYSEAEEWALTSVNLLDNPTTKSGSKREIGSWSVAINPVSKAGESSTDTLFYVFNFANDEGFSIISASNSIQPILAVTESGSYTVGEPTGNDAFDS